MFLKDKITFYNLTPEAIHRKMKCRIIILNRINQFANRNLCIQFFFDFPLQCILWGFSFFDFSSWKFPSVFKFTITSLGCKNNWLSIFIYCFYYCRYYVSINSSYGLAASSDQSDSNSLTIDCAISPCSMLTSCVFHSIFVDKAVCVILELPIIIL